MLNLNLVDDLVSFLTEALKEMQLPTKDESVLKAPTVYDGYLPPKKNVRRGESTEDEDYPFVIVRYLGEEDDLDKEDTIHLRIIVGTYSTDEQYGWRDTLNVMNRIKIAVKKQQTIGSASLTGKIEIALFEEHLKPMWHGVMEMQFTMPQIEWEGSSVLDEY